jgi:asparagine N-glycosylation enzyme membrane subunit Stt3
MSRHVLFAIGGVIVGLILLSWIPWYITALIIVAAIAIPATAYLMLDPSQRRRLREQRRRGQLGR